MPLELYLRGEIWWFRGRIDDIPGSRYYRRSTGASGESAARRIVADYEAREIKRHFVGTEKAITFAEAVMLYTPTPGMAKDLARILPHLADRECTSITPAEVRALGAKIFPDGATDYWQRHVITPIRAVINKAHDRGMAPPIKIRGFTKSERLRQDRARGKQSRTPKTPGSWEWIIAFRTEANRYLGALALFMFETGARIGQATQIKPGDLDLQNHRVWMPEAKGVEAQWVTISTDLVVELANLPPRRPRARRLSNKQLPAKVFGYAGKDGVYGAWRRACERAGIEVIAPHAAGRHGFGTEMITRQGIDPATVAAAGRWSDVPNLLRTYVHPEDSTSRIQSALRTGRVQAESGGAAKSKQERRES